MNKIRQNVFPVLAAVIWGLAFSAQDYCASKGMEPFTFNVYRSLIAAIVIFLVSALFAKGFKNLFARFKNKTYSKNLILGGLCCGGALFLASNLQQAAFAPGIESGKIGFITVFYLMLVPVFGLFIKKKAPINVWVSVFIALVGMYFLCVKEGTSFSINIHDLYALLCAVMFSIQILFIDHFVSKVDGVHLSLMQFIVVTIFSSFGMLFFESPSFSALGDCIWQVSYVGVFSSGVAYTLQILAQKDSNPTVVSLLLSLESVFAVIFGMFILDELMSTREFIGCGIMFFSVILSQIPVVQIKSRLSLILTFIGIILLALAFLHWLFAVSAIFFFISAILSRKNKKHRA